jgi:3'-5' exonuclease
MLGLVLMSEQSIIVWDLETVPDLAAAARMLDMGNAPEADVRQALRSGFPKHPLHKIVCIGALIASSQPEGWRVDALGAPHIGERSEGELISAFVERVSQLHPQLITFNGPARSQVSSDGQPSLGCRPTGAAVFSPLHRRCARPLRRLGLFWARRKGEARRN